MSFLKKIQKVLAMLSPWSAAKPVKKKRRTKKKLTRKPIRKKIQRVKAEPQKKKTAKKVTKKQPQKKVTEDTRVKTVSPKKDSTKNTKKTVAAKKLKTVAVSKPALKPVKIKRVLVGEVTHYFDRVKVAAFMVTGAPIVLGDALEFESKTGVFRQEIKSLQIDRVAVKSARAGDEVGLLVKKPVREGDYVFKVLD